jgi:hypothetical protein
MQRAALKPPLYTHSKAADKQCQPPDTAGKPVISFTTQYNLNLLHSTAQTSTAQMLTRPAGQPATSNTNNTATMSLCSQHCLLLAQHMAQVWCLQTSHDKADIRDPVQKLAVVQASVLGVALLSQLAALPKVVYASQPLQYVFSPAKGGICLTASPVCFLSPAAC